MTNAIFARPVARVRLLAPLAGAALLALGCSGGSGGGPSAPLTANAPPQLLSASPADSVLTAEVGQALSFSVAGTDPDGSPVTYQFLVDGERRSSEASFRLTADAPGARTVEARISDGVHVVRRRWEVTVTPDLPHAPVASLSVMPDSGSAPLEVTIGLAGTDADGRVVQWQVDADADGTYEVSGPEAPAGLRHVFAAGGTFRVRARLTDDEGLVTLAERLVRVTENLPPRASLGVSPEAGPAPLEVRVTGSGTDPEGAVTLYELDVDGDGRFDVVRPTPIDTVLTLEDYTRPVEIALRVTDAGGRTGEERRTVRPLPNVDVEGSSLSQSGSGRLRADGSASRLVSLQVVDPSGKPLPAVEVEVASSRNAGAAGTVDRLSPTRGVTDGLGRFETLFSTTSSSSLLGDAVVGARAGGRELEQTITVQFSSAVSAAASRLSCPLSSVHVDGSTSQPQGARIRATVQDAQEQPLAGIHVRLGTRDLGLYRVTPAEGRTDGSGTFEFTVSSDLAGTSTFVDLYADGLKTSAMCTVSFDS